jgi:hypothetical protein
MNAELGLLLEAANSEALAASQQRDEERVEAQAPKKLKVDDPLARYVVI